MKIPILILLMGLSSSVAAQTADEFPVEAALRAAPEDLRAEATVQGFDAEGRLVVLKAGTNALICTADDPAREGFSAACHHRDMEPYIARGRALRAAGHSFPEVQSIRAAEVEAGELPFPGAPTVNYILYGGEVTFDPATGELSGAHLRYVVYTPYATAESTGLALKPMAPGAPWLMDAGTFRAHVMIVPPTQ